MSRLFPLETFAPLTARAQSLAPVASSEADLEALRLEAFDTGYKSGWDDAASAQSADQNRIGEEFARNLRDLGFTYHEARAHVVSATENVLVQFVESFFAEFVADALVSQIREVTRSAIEDAASDPILVRVSPQDATALRELLSAEGPVPFEVDEEPSLATGQVYCVLGSKERKVDLAGLVDTTRNALAALHELNERTLKHG